MKGPEMSAAVVVRLQHAVRVARMAATLDRLARDLRRHHRRAVFLLALALVAPAHAAPRLVTPLDCPTVADWTDDTLALPEGCPAPRAGRLYTLQAHADVAAELAQLDSLLEDRDRQIEAARAERDAARIQAAADLAAAATKIDGLAAEVAALSDPPRRSVWLAFGALLGGGAIVVSDRAGLDGMTSAGIGLGVLAGAGLLSAWLDAR